MAVAQYNTLTSYKGTVQATDNRNSEDEKLGS